MRLKNLSKYEVYYDDKADPTLLVVNHETNVVIHFYEGTDGCWKINLVDDAGERHVLSLACLQLARLYDADPFSFDAPHEPPGHGRYDFNRVSIEARMLADAQAGDARPVIKYIEENHKKIVKYVAQKLKRQRIVVEDTLDLVVDRFLQRVQAGRFVQFRSIERCLANEYIVLKQQKRRTSIHINEKKM